MCKVSLDNYGDDIIGNLPLSVLAEKVFNGEPVMMLLQKHFNTHPRCEVLFHLIANKKQVSDVLQDADGEKGAWFLTNYNHRFILINSLTGMVETVSALRFNIIKKFENGYCNIYISNKKSGKVQPLLIGNVLYEYKKQNSVGETALRNAESILFVNDNKKEVHIKLATLIGGMHYGFKVLETLGNSGVTPYVLHHKESYRTAADKYLAGYGKHPDRIGNLQLLTRKQHLDVHAQEYRSKRALKEEDRRKQQAINLAKLCLI